VEVCKEQLGYRERNIGKTRASGFDFQLLEIGSVGIEKGIQLRLDILGNANIHRSGKGE